MVTSAPLEPLKPVTGPCGQWQWQPNDLNGNGGCESALALLNARASDPFSSTVYPSQQQDNRHLDALCAQRGSHIERLTRLTRLTSTPAF